MPPDRRFWLLVGRDVNRSTHLMGTADCRERGMGSRSGIAYTTVGRGLSLAAILCRQSSVARSWNLSFQP